jgi:hypothetical protein
MDWQERIISHTPEEIQAHCEGILASWRRFPGNPKPERSGFVCSLFHPGSGELLMPPLFIGAIPHGKAASYAFYSLEKGIRLAAKPSDMTSRRSADALPDTLPPTKRSYGGAVQSPQFLIASISGFPWEGDQAAACALLDRMGLLNDGMLEEIAAESQNTLSTEFVQFDREQRL